MTELPEDVARAFERHDAFEAADGPTFAVTTTPFDAVVAVRADGGVTAEVTVWTPTLSAAVVDGDAVADVVEEGWLETFERRMEDADQPLSPGQAVDPVVRTEADEVVVEATVEAGSPGTAVEDARALVEYVEGTFVAGVVPGYEYDEPVASILERARQTGETDAAP